MGREPELGPSFFKVLIGDFANKLFIPPEFVKKRKGKLPVRPLLKTGCGRSWDVMIEQVDEHGYCFGNGWLEFVNYHNLQLGADMSNVFKDPKIESDGDGDGAKPEAYGCQDTYFVSVLKKSDRKKLFLPVRFVRESGIARKRSAVLKDPKGRLWAAELTSSAWRKNRYYVSQGWADLQRVNNIKEGDTCVFKFLESEGNVVQVQVLKKPAAAHHKKRGRGRPLRSSYLLP